LYAAFEAPEIVTLFPAVNRYDAEVVTVQIFPLVAIEDTVLVVLAPESVGGVTAPGARVDAIVKTVVLEMVATVYTPL
jgi:hypothetical protein